ncbi:MAG: efflux RND transporter periplasmic adaptor subunit [Rhodospirillaceae bacterium]
MHVSRLLIGLLVLVALATGLYFGYPAFIAQSDGESSAGVNRSAGFSGNRSIPVIAMPVYQETLSDRLEAIGTVQANESIVVTAKLQGIVKSIGFDDGQYVTAGKTLVQFDEDELNARLQVELANMDEQRKQFDRISGLARANATSEARFDEQQASVRKAEANVAAARARLADYTIKAPFAGRLGTRRISIGALVSPGTTITTLDDLSVVKLDFSVPETYLATLREGLDIEATTSTYKEQIFRGIVTSIDTRVDQLTRTISIRAEIANEARYLRPGMLMVVDLIKDLREGLIIAEEALVPFETQQYVFVVNDDKTVTRVPVTIGQRRPGSVEILTGLSAGDLVVTEGNMMLSSGKKVRLLNDVGARTKPLSARTSTVHG